MSSEMNEKMRRVEMVDEIIFLLYIFYLLSSILYIKIVKLNIKELEGFIYFEKRRKKKMMVDEINNFLINPFYHVISQSTIIISHNLPSHHLSHNLPS